MIEDIAHWPTGPTRIVWHGPDLTGLPISGAHGFCFSQGQVLICDIDGRGPTIPGGHLEHSESAVDCLIRETREEACVELAVPSLLGFIEADHRGNDAYDGRYPLRSAQAIFRADIARIGEFVSASESTSRRLVDPAELPAVHHEWNKVLQAAFSAALEQS